MSDHTVMIHKDGEDGPIHGADLAKGVLRVEGALCPRCEASPLDVKAWRSSRTHREHSVYHAVYCVACECHVGTSKSANGSLFGHREDLAMHGGRWRVYGGAMEGVHGDLAAGQFESELAIARAKRGAS